MKVKSNISFQTLLNYLQLDAEIISSTLDNFPLVYLKNTPEKVSDIPFKDYAVAVKCMTDIKHASKLVSVITGVAEEKILKMKAVKVYPIYINYAKQVKNLVDKFNDINSEVPQSKTRVVKTMEEFGLSNIIDYISNERPELFDMFWNMSTGKVYVEYKRKTHKMINILANNGKDTK